MKDNIVASLKLVYKPLIMYYGEWELLPGLEAISKEKNGKNLYKEFIDRYYYMPLKVIFKDEDLARTFDCAICSRLGMGGRTLYFSKVAFLRSVIADADEFMANSDEDTYQVIKKAIRDKKDVYRDVYLNGKESPYYEEVKEEHKASGLKISLDEFITLCKKKYTKLLTGFNAVLDLLDKSINVDNFIDCFDVNQLYLFTCYSILKHSEKYYDAYGKLDYNIIVFDSYVSLVEELRKADSFYNSHIVLGDVVYTIDDLFKEYDELIKRAEGK